ncbi:hypothetical protein MPSEU_000985200 [Mayamaea pseudoterrestris]|nr:hypothetical protein MPSEU_000985200 [Mayamaea pseudoterrestris]
MKFSLGVLSALFSIASAAVDITSDSAVGKHLVSKARRLDGEVDWETEYAWMTGYSVKFQGCLAVKQWNDEADDKEDVRIATKRLVRFRMCPSDSCSANKAAGCSSGYGDYIIDMDTFMQSYIEGKRTSDEWECANYLAATCDCEDSDDKGDDFNAEYCEYDCFKNAGMSQCIDRNPYEDDQGNQDEFKLEDYMECKEVKAQNNDNGDNNNNGEDQAQYFVGPYCSSQGGSIKLGLFTDDSCSVEAEDVDFYSMFGYKLPYSGSSDSLIDAKCLSCKETQNQDNQNENDQADADAVSQMCEEVYLGAGKCESSYPSGMVTTPNNNACTYMEGVKVIRQDGIIDTGSSRPSAVATSFIVIFAMAFCAMAFYVWYLRTRLGVKKNTLL